MREALRRRAGAGGRRVPAGRAARCSRARRPRSCAGRAIRSTPTGSPTHYAGLLDGLVADERADAASRRSRPTSSLRDPPPRRAAWHARRSPSPRRSPTGSTARPVERTRRSRRGGRVRTGTRLRPSSSVRASDWISRCRSSARPRHGRRVGPLPAVAPHRRAWPAAMTWLGAVAATSQGAMLGTSVLTPTMRYHPSIVAQAFATIAQLSPARSSSASGPARR